MFTLIIFLLSLLLGCNAPTKNNQKTTAGQETDISKTDENFNAIGYPIVKKPITVTSMFAPGTYDGDPKEMSYWQKLEEISNIQIKWNMISSSEPTAIQLFFSAGDFPDFFHAYVDNERQFIYGVEGGMFYDYSDLIYEYMPNLVSWFKKYPEAEKVIRQLNGAIYTLPKIQVHSTYSIGQMFYRTDYLKKLNLEIPKTVDDFYNVLKAIKDSGLTGGYAPFLPLNKGTFEYHTEAFLFSAFGDAHDYDFADDGKGKVVYNRISEQYRRYLEYANKLYKEGLLENELFTIDSDTSSGRIKAGQAAFMTSADMLAESDFPDGKINIDCLAPLTSQYTSERKVKGYIGVSSSAAAINKNCKYVRELLRMFDMNYTEDEVVPGSGLNCLSQNIGLEGVNWKYTNNEKSHISFLQPDDWDSNVWLWITKYASWNQFYSAWVTYATTGGANNIARETGMLKNNLPYAKPSFPDTLIKVTEEENNVIANKLTDINNFVAQARAQFITGIEPLSKWDAYVAKVKEMGIDEILEIKQKAYDRWNE